MGRTPKTSKTPESQTPGKPNGSGTPEPKGGPNNPPTTLVFQTPPPRSKTPGSHGTPNAKPPGSTTSSSSKRGTPPSNSKSKGSTGNPNSKRTSDSDSNASHRNENTKNKANDGHGRSASKPPPPVNPNKTRKTKYRYPESTKQGKLERGLPLSDDDDESDHSHKRSTQNDSSDDSDDDSSDEASNAPKPSSDEDSHLDKKQKKSSTEDNDHRNDHPVADEDAHGMFSNENSAPPPATQDSKKKQNQTKADAKATSQNDSHNPNNSNNKDSWSRMDYHQKRDDLKEQMLRKLGVLPPLSPVMQPGTGPEPSPPPTNPQHDLDDHTKAPANIGNGTPNTGRDTMSPTLLSQLYGATTNQNYFNAYHGAAASYPINKYSLYGIHGSIHPSLGNPPSITTTPFKSMLPQFSESPIRAPVARKLVDDSSERDNAEDTMNESHSPPAKRRILLSPIDKMKLSKSLETEHGAKLNWTIDLTNLSNAEGSVRAEAIFKLNDHLRALTRKPCPWLPILTLQDNTANKPFCLINDPIRCPPITAKPIAQQRLCAGGNSFDQARFNIAYNDPNSAIYASKMLASKLTSSLDETSQNLLAHEAEMLGIPEPISQDGLWCYSWIFNKLCPNKYSWHLILKAYMETIIPKGSDDLVILKDYILKMNSMKPYAINENVETELIGTIFHIFCHCKNIRLQTVFKDKLAGYSSYGEVVTVDMLISLAENYLREEINQTTLSGTAVHSTDDNDSSILTMNATSNSRPSSMRTPHVSFKQGSTPPHNRQSHTGNKKESKYRYTPEWKRNPPDTNGLTRARKWIDPGDHSESWWRWCQTCKVWTTAIDNHQKNHRTGHPNDLSDSEYAEIARKRNERNNNNGRSHPPRSNSYNRRDSHHNSRSHGHNSNRTQFHSNRYNSANVATALPLQVNDALATAVAHKILEIQKNNKSSAS